MKRRPGNANLSQEIGEDQPMDALLQDVRFALRQWQNRPGLFAITVLTIALGTGAISTVMSITDSVLVRSRPGVREPDGLVEIRVANRAGRGARPMAFSTLQVLQASPTGMVEVAGGDYAEVSVSTPGGEPELVAAAFATNNFFSVLRTESAIGRLFSPEEEGSAVSPVVVLSYSFWSRLFNRDPSVLGSTLRLNRQPFTVIGVAERGFRGHLPLYDFQLFVPMSTMELLTGTPPYQTRVLTVGRLAPGSSLERVRAATGRVEEELRGLAPSEWASASFLIEPHDRSFQEFRGPITLFLGFLLALSGCVLLVASANLGGILASQALTRSREVAVRQALGAGRRRLIRQIFTESFFLFLLGGASGFLLAAICTHWLGRIELPENLPFRADFGPDLGVFALCMTLTVGVGLLFSLPPAFKTVRGDLSSILRTGVGQCPGRFWLRSAFVVAQVIAAVVLIGASGALFRALQYASSLELGFEPEGAHVATLNLGIQGYSDDEGRIFFSRLLEEARSVPGVVSAALADFVFLVSPPQRAGTFTSPEGEGSVMAGLMGVSTDFFSTLDIRVLEGRAFDQSDLEGSEPVAIVNEVVADILWPGQNPVGKTLTTGEVPLRVVGLVENGKYISMGETPLAAVFRPHPQHYVPKASLILKAGGGGPNLGKRIQDLVTSFDPEIPLSTNSSYDQLIGGALLPRRAAAFFAGIMGALCLFLAAVGLFGVLAELAARRSPELAIRIALGAPPRSVRAGVIRRGMALVILGLLLGLPLSVSITSLARVFLFGMDPADPTSLSAVSLLFLIMGYTASYVPSSRATRADPARILQRG